MDKIKKLDAKGEKDDKVMMQLQFSMVPKTSDMMSNLLQDVN